MKKIIITLMVVLSLICFFPETTSAYYLPTNQMQCVSRKLEDAAMKYMASVDVSSCQLAADELNSSFWDEAKTYMYGGLFTKFQYHYKGNLVTRIDIEYNYAEESTKRYQNDYLTKVNQLLAKIGPSMTDLDKLFFLHNYLVLNSAYDMDAYYSYNDHLMSYSLFGPLLYQLAVCQGYTGAYTDLLRRLGMQSIYVSSKQMNHSWNLVKVNGEWYHVDLTWDDPVPDTHGYVRYDYFLMNDSEISKTHTLENNTLKSQSTAMMNQNYIFNQKISDGDYKNGNWYYVQSGKIYRSQIDSTGKEQVGNVANVADIVIEDDRIFYTTTTDGKYLDAIYQMTLDGMNVSLVQTLDKGKYPAGLTSDGSYLYVYNNSTKQRNRVNIPAAISTKPQTQDIAVSDVTLSSTFDYSKYGNGLFPIYENSRVTYGKLQGSQLRLSGYSLEQFNSYKKPDSFVREIVFVEMNSGQEYRASLKAKYDPYLNTNKTLNPDGKYDYSYAYYDSVIDLNHVQSYWTKAYTALPRGTYRVFIRMSDGKRSNVISLRNTKSDVTLAGPFFMIENSNDVGIKY